MNFKLFIVFMVLSSTIFSQNSKGAKKAPATVKKTAPLPPPRIIVPANYGSVQDIDGNTYRTIKIGEQTWMADNLKTKRFNDGTAISNIKDNFEYSFHEGPNWNYYNNDYSKNSDYGKLYNAYVVNNELNVCPTGWHIPSRNEFITLFKSIGEFVIDEEDNSVSSYVAGEKLKSQQFWNRPNKGALNTSFFNALPGGTGLSEEFGGMGNYAYYWSSDRSKRGENWCLSLLHDQEYGH